MAMTVTDNLPVVIDAPELETKLVSSLLTIFADEPVEEKGTERKVRPVRKMRAAASKKASGHRVTYTLVDAGDKRAVRISNAVHQAVKMALISSHRGFAFDPAIIELAEVIERTLPKARQQRSEQAIEKMVDALVETHDPIAKVSAEIDAANAQARVKFIRNFMTLTSEEVTEAAGSVARNRSQTASRWKAEGKIFGLLWQGQDRFPAFQFKDGRPRSVIGKILAALPSAMSPWEIAFWMVSTNSWLDGQAPRAVLDDEDRVVAAAREQAEAVIG